MSYHPLNRTTNNPNNKIPSQTKGTNNQLKQQALKGDLKEKSFQSTVFRENTIQNNSQHILLLAQKQLKRLIDEMQLFQTNTINSYVKVNKSNYQYQMINSKDYKQLKQSLGDIRMRIVSSTKIQELKIKVQNLDNYFKNTKVYLKRLQTNAKDKLRYGAQNYLNSIQSIFMNFLSIKQQFLESAKKESEKPKLIQSKEAQSLNIKQQKFNLNQKDLQNESLKKANKALQQKLKQLIKNAGQLERLKNIQNQYNQIKSKSQKNRQISHSVSCQISKNIQIINQCIQQIKKASNIPKASSRSILNRKLQNIKVLLIQKQQNKSNTKNSHNQHLKNKDLKIEQQNLHVQDVILLQKLYIQYTKLLQKQFIQIVNELNNSCKNLVSTNTSLQTKIKEYTQLQRKQQRQIGKLTNQINLLRPQNPNKDNKIKILQDQKIKAKTLQEDYKKSIKVQQQLKEIKLQNQRLANQVKAYKGQIQEVQKRYKEQIETIKKDHKLKIQAKKEQINFLEASRPNMQQQRKKAVHHLKTLHQNEKHQIISGYNQTIKLKDQTIDNKIKEIQNLQSQIEKLTQSILKNEQQQDKSKIIQDELIKAKQQITKIRQQNLNLASKVQKYKQQLQKIGQISQQQQIETPKQQIDITGEINQQQIKTIKQQHQKQIDNLKNDHQSKIKQQINKLDDEFKKFHQDEKTKIISEHTLAIAQKDLIIDNNNKQIQDLKSQIITLTKQIIPKDQQPKIQQNPSMDQDNRSNEQPTNINENEIPNNNQPGQNLVQLDESRQEDLHIVPKVDGSPQSPIKVSLQQVLDDTSVFQISLLEPTPQSTAKIEELEQLATQKLLIQQVSQKDILISKLQSQITTLKLQIDQLKKIQQTSKSQNPANSHTDDLKDHQTTPYPDNQKTNIIDSQTSQNLISKQQEQINNNHNNNPSSDIKPLSSIMQSNQINQLQQKDTIQYKTQINKQMKEFFEEILSKLKQLFKITQYKIQQINPDKDTYLQNETEVNIKSQKTKLTQAKHKITYQFSQKLQSYENRLINLSENNQMQSESLQNLNELVSICSKLSEVLQNRNQTFIYKYKQNLFKHVQLEEIVKKSQDITNKINSATSSFTFQIAQKIKERDFLSDQIKNHNKSLTDLSIKLDQLKVNIQIRQQQLQGSQNTLKQYKTSKTLSQQLIITNSILSKQKDRLEKSITQFLLQFQKLSNDSNSLNQNMRIENQKIRKLKLVQSERQKYQELKKTDQKNNLKIKELEKKNNEQASQITILVNAQDEWMKYKEQLIKQRDNLENRNAQQMKKAFTSIFNAKNKIQQNFITALNKPTSISKQYNFDSLNNKLAQSSSQLTKLITDQNENMRKQNEKKLRQLKQQNQKLKSQNQSKQNALSSIKTKILQYREFNQLFKEESEKSKSLQYIQLSKTINKIFENLYSSIQKLTKLNKQHHSFDSFLTLLINQIKTEINQEDQSKINKGQTQRLTAMTSMGQKKSSEQKKHRSIIMAQKNSITHSGHSSLILEGDILTLKSLMSSLKDYLKNKQIQLRTNSDGTEKIKIIIKFFRQFTSKFQQLYAKEEELMTNKLNGMYKTHSIQIQTLRQQKQKSQTAIQTAMTNLRKLQDEKKALQLECDKLGEENDLQGEKLKSLQQKLLTAQSNVTSNYKQLKQKQQSLERIRQQLSKKQTSIQTLTKQIENIQNSRSQQAGKTQILNTQLASQAKNNLQQISILKQQAQHLQVQLNSKRTEIQGLKENLERIGEALAQKFKMQIKDFTGTGLISSIGSLKLKNEVGMKLITSSILLGKDVYRQKIIEKIEVFTKSTIFL